MVCLLSFNAFKTIYLFVYISNLSRTNSISKLVALNKTIYIILGIAFYQKALSIVIVTIVLLRLKAIYLKDTKLLLILLYFLISLKVPLNFLLYRASPRKHWNKDSGIEEINAYYISLFSKLAHLLLNTIKLINSFYKLLLLLVISRNSNLTYILNKAI